MVDSAMVSTMTMLVAADRPPMNTASASQGRSNAIGRVRTKVSASTVPSGKVSSPASAIGITNRLISSRYSGNSQMARRICCSSLLSTTVTWNCRGSSITAKAASSEIATQS